MHRRTVLRRAAAATPLALAGCLGDSGVTPTPTPTPGVDVTSVETVDTSCSTGNTGVASLSADANRHEVTITGTVEASDPCHLAELVSTAYDDGTLSTTVGVARDDQDGCIECVGAIEYRATIRLATGGEAEVVVSHGTASDATEVRRETVEL